MKSLRSGSSKAGCSGLISSGGGRGIAAISLAPGVSGASSKTSVSTVATAIAPRGSWAGSGGGLSKASVTKAFFSSAAFRAAAAAASDCALTLAAAASAAASLASARLRSAAGSLMGAGFDGSALFGASTTVAFILGRAPDCSTFAGSARKAESVSFASLSFV